jgi:hypothetical protein
LLALVLRALVLATALFAIAVQCPLSSFIGMITFMTCMVPTESALTMTAHQHGASVFATEVHAPLCGPLAMIACFVLIAALGAALYDYASTVPTADTIVLPGHTCVVPASEIEELHRLRHC